MNTDFDSLKRTKSYIGDHLSRCTTKKKYGTPVLIYQEIGVNLLEVLIKPKSAGTLNSVSKKLATPTPPKGGRALFPQKSGKACRNAIVLDRVHLKIMKLTYQVR